MYFEKSSLEVQNSAEFVTKIYIDTSGADVAGSDVIINFNPVFLKATKVEPGLIFDDYPLAAIDSEKGIVSVSGVSGSVDNLFNGDDVVAKITWQAQKTGITEVSFDFTEGSTKDSNIAVSFGNGDILGEVGTATVTIVPGQGATVTTEPETVMDTAVEEEESKGIIDRLTDAINGLLGKSESIDPYKPIVRQDPNEDLDRDLSGTFTFASIPRRLGQLSPLAYLIILIALLLTTLLIYKIVKRIRKSANQTPVVSQNLDGSGKPPSSGIPPVMPPGTSG